MKAIVRKELRQGRPLVIFAIVLVGVVVCARLVLIGTGHGEAFAGGPNDNWRTAHTGYDGVFMVALGALPLLLALFAGVGLFASEAEHGTLPVLFMLPYSRRQIWAAKLLAAVALSIGPSLAMLLVVKYLMPALFPFVGVTPWVDLVLLTVAVLGIGMFVTVLTPHVIGAVMAAVALAVALSIAVFVGLKQVGMPVLGYDELLDFELWVALAAPALLYTSLRAVVKGELLEWRGSAFVHVPMLLAGLAITLGTVSVTGRALTGYDRGSVGVVIPAATEPGARALPVLSLNRETPYERKTFYEEHGTYAEQWLGWGRREGWNGPYALRNHSAVVLDLKTGKERAVVRDSLFSEAVPAGVSPDGKYAAVAVAPVGLTWGGFPNRTAARQLEVIELATGRRLYAGTPEPLRKKDAENDGVSGIAWSASGEYLAFTTGTNSGSANRLHVMRRDGSGVRTVADTGSAGTWAWSPHEDGLYVVNEGAVERAFPEAMNSRVWPAAKDERESVRTLDAQGFSPDGQWVVVTASAAASGDGVRPQGGRPKAQEGWSPGGRRGRVVPLGGGGGGMGRGGRMGRGGGMGRSGGGGGGGGRPAWVGDRGPRAQLAPTVTATMLVAVTREGRESRVIWREGGGWNAAVAWEGGVLYALVTRTEQSPKHPVTTAHLLCWRPGEAQATEVQAATPYPNALLAPVAGQGVLLWPMPRRRVDEATRQEVEVPSPVGPAVLTHDGVLREFPNAQDGARYAQMNRHITIDDRGRLITLVGHEVEATDLRTGARAKVYP